MACCPPETTGIFDSSQPSYANSYRFRVPAGVNGQLTATGLQPGDEVVVTTQSPTDPTQWVPLIIGGSPVILTADNPSVDLPPGLYRVVPSASTADNNPPAVVTGFTYSDVGLTSVPAYYGAPGNYVEVEVVRVSEFGDPRVYYAGTDIEIVGYDPDDLYFELGALGAPQQEHAGSEYLTANSTVNVPAGGYLVAQNRTGLGAQYSYDGTHWFSMGVNELVTFNALQSVMFMLDGAFVQTGANPGIMVARFEPE